MNTYTITSNPHFGSVEIAFSGKPDQATRDALKALRFRWHGVRRIWYGYKDEETVRAAIEGKSAHEASKSDELKPAANKYGVRVGDIFSASWGYDETHVDFFQVVSLVGSQSVRVREVNPLTISEDAVSSMSADRTYRITRELLPPSKHTVFIDDQERGDLKRLKSHEGGAVTFKLASFANAHLCTGDEVKTYESWYR